MGPKRTQVSSRSSDIYGAELSALLELTDALPPELYPSDEAAYHGSRPWQERDRHAVSVWRSGDQKQMLKRLKRWGGLNPVALIFKGLEAAPDEAGNVHEAVSLHSGQRLKNDASN